MREACANGETVGKLPQTLGFVNTMREASANMNAIQTIEATDVRGDSGGVADEVAPATDNIDLVSECQDCIIELLAIEIEGELPLCFGEKRPVLARELALATHRFIVGFARVTGHLQELYGADHFSS